MNNLFKTWRVPDLRYEREAMMEKVRLLSIGVEKDPEFAKESGAPERIASLLAYIDQITDEIASREVADIPF